MSRREGRDSHGKRLHSTRFDREPSPKRSRRDGKPATERKYSNRDILEITEQIDSDQKHPRRFQDTLLLEANSAPGSKAQSDVLNKKLEKKADAFSDAVKHSSDPADVPRSRSYFQHDERGSAGQSDRSFGRRAAEKRGLRLRDVPREQSSDKTKEKATSKDLQLKEEKVPDVHRRDKSQTRLDDGIWRHDKYHELAVDAPPARRRPAFREHKLPTEDLAASGKQPETVKPSFHQRPGYGSAKREEQGVYPYPHGQEERAEKTFTGADDRTTGWEDRSLRWGEMRGAGYRSREGFGSGGGGGGRGRDSYNGRHGERSQNQVGGSHVDRWKHDLFDEANRSPTPKNEEDEIAKLEALLAS